MGQVTLYLDEQTEERMRRAAAEAGLSQSRWVAELIRRRTASEWPESVRRLAGAWPDFPTLEEIRSGAGEDLPREPL
jgi:hypothetical protein